jgi:L-lactate dehydrogenase complex protein LldG
VNGGSDEPDRPERGAAKLAEAVLVREACMYESFKSRAEAVSAEVHRFGSGAEAARFLSDFLVKEGVADEPGKRAVWTASPAFPGVDPQAFVGRFPGLTLQVTKEKAAESKVGISAVEWGLADTGTLVQDATDVSLRLASTLPEIHVALLRTSRIVADLQAVLPGLAPGKSPYIAFITGPSRTADIERVLTIGVHGPVRLVILAVDDQPVAAEGKPS